MYPEELTINDIVELPQNLGGCLVHAFRLQILDNFDSETKPIVPFILSIFDFYYVHKYGLHL